MWILGDSYVRRGEEAARKSLGCDLGLSAQVKWFGWGGLRWRGVLPFFAQSLRGRSVPEVLLIHCGGNDLGKVKSVDLAAEMKQDLCDLHRRHPQMTIIFSAVTQRRRWGLADPKKIDRSRKWLNNVMACFMKGGIVRHPDIHFDNPALFLRDNVHLSSRGNDIFMNSIVECLKKLELGL